jgi:hypothetical protein
LVLDGKLPRDRLLFGQVFALVAPTWGHAGFPNLR